MTGDTILHSQRSMSGFRIALFLIDRDNDFQALLRSDCEQAARRHDLHVATFFAENNAETQIRQIRGVLAAPESARPRALVIAPVSEVALMPLVHDAARLGVAWVLLSRWSDSIHEFRTTYPSVPIFVVTPDHLEIGRLQGQQLRLLLRPDDELVYIQGPMATYSTRRRRAGLEKELADRLDFQWSYINGDWSVQGGLQAMRSWLSTFTTRVAPSFVIAAQNDSMAMGAREAVGAWGLQGGRFADSDLRVIGCDGSPNYGQHLTTRGELQATVIIPPLTTRAVEELVNAFRFGRQPAAEMTVPVRSYPDLQTLAAEVRQRK